MVIIGGGVIGVCAALYLTRQGKRVTLLEKKRLCAGASHGNASWIAVHMIVPTAAPGVLGQGIKWMLDPGSPFYIKPRANLDLVRWLWQFRRAAAEKPMLAGTDIMNRLNRAGLRLFKELDSEGLAFDFAQRGLLHLHLSEKKRKAGLKEMAFVADYGVKAELLGRAGLEELEPHLKPGIESGIFYPDTAHLRPDKFVQAVGDLAEKEGATIVEGAQVTGFEFDNGHISAVKTNIGHYSGIDVVLAAGAWSAPLAKLAGETILMEPAKGYSITASRPSPGHGPQRPISVDDYKLAITPFGTDFRFSSTLELAGFDPSINQKRIAVNREGLNRVFDGFETLNIKETWSGYRPLSADTLPIIGRSEQHRNLIYATGHGMMGITQGPITGQMVTDIVIGQTPEIELEPLRPGRW